MKKIFVLLLICGAVLCGCTHQNPLAESTQPTQTSASTTEALMPTTQPLYVYGQNLDWDTLPVYEFSQKSSFAHSNVWLDGEDFIPMDREEALSFFGENFDLQPALTGAKADDEGLNYGVYFEESKGYYETENRFHYTLSEDGSIAMILSRQEVMEIFPQEAYDAPKFAVINDCNVLLGQHDGEEREVYAQLAVGETYVLLRFRDVPVEEVLAVLDYLTIQNK